MDPQSQPTFFKALQQVLANGIAAVTLSTEEVFFLANDLCPRDQRIRYGTYLRFIHSLNEYGEPAETNSQNELLLDIYDYLQAKEAQQKTAMLEAIQAGQKDWRRFVWLLQFRQKEERLKLAQAKQQERERKEQQKAAEVVAQKEETAFLPSSVNTAKPVTKQVPSASPQDTTTGQSWMYYKKVGG